MFFGVVEIGLVIDRLEQVGQHLLRRLAACPRLHAADELAEFEQGFELPGLHAVGKAFLEGRVEQRDVPLTGVLPEHLQGCRANTAPGRGCRTDEGRIVVLVGEQAQIAGQILDLGLVEERLAAGQQIGNLLVAQLRFEQAGLVIRAVEDGVVAELAAMLEAMGLQLHDHALGLGLVVLAGGDVDRVAVAKFRPQGLVEQFLVV